MIEGLREADDFKNFRVNDFYRDIAYLPFAVLAIGGLIFTLVAWAQSLEYIRASAAKDVSRRRFRACLGPNSARGSKTEIPVLESLVTY
jgi:hypothetical protein